MGSRSLLLLLLLCVFSVEGLFGRCGHSAKQPASVPQRHLPRGSSPSLGLNAYQREQEWEPIRIQVYYGDLNLTDSMKERLTGAVRGATNWFKRTLSVRPITQSWKLRYKSCGGIDFKGDILRDEFEADFVLYVLADSEQNRWVGYSIYCQVDKDTDQPVVGLFYFNGDFHADKPDEQVLATTIHEMTHSLVFDSYLYRKYRKPNGQKYTERELFVNETVRGVSVQKLALPTVTQKARDAFNCTSLNGVELEDDGSQGSVGVHWEKRVMHNEYMVADAEVFDVLYSDVTVALFQDSGWYHVSYKYTTPIQWGRNRGCGFLTRKCVEDGTPISSDFCSERKKESCDFMRLRSGLCNLHSYNSTLPPEHQYFSDPHLGSSDKYIDYCPVISPYIDGDCRDPNTLYVRPKNQEKGGINSRCFERVVNFLTTSQKTEATCYPVDCSSNSPKITIGNKTHTCPAEGGHISILKDVVYCPPRDEICRDVPCINNCYGFGYCVKGTCVCDDGTDSCNYEYS